MSFVLLGILNSQAAGGAGKYFIGTFGAPGDQYGQGIDTDSENNIYIGGYGSGALGDNDTLMLKLDSNGELLWQQAYGNSRKQEFGYIAVDANDTLYAASETRDFTAAQTTDAIIGKFDTSGTLLLQKGIQNTSSATFDEPQNVAGDVNGNFYMTVQLFSFPNDTGYLQKWNSSGTLQWQRRVGQRAFSYGITTDSSGNAYWSGRFFINDFDSNYFVVKFDSSGNQLYNTQISFGNGDFKDVAVDTSGNCYGVGLNKTGGDTNASIIKFNSSGGKVWDRRFGSNTGERFFGVDVDSQGNIYALGYTTSSGTEMMIVKYDPNGNLQWQRTLASNVSGTTTGERIAIDSSDSICVVGTTTSTSDGSSNYFFARLPNDGSLEGTYNLGGVDFTYAASSFTSSGNIFATTSGVSVSTSGLGQFNPNLTTATISQTLTTTEI